jgi:hypothetical protein
MVFVQRQESLRLSEALFCSEGLNCIALHSLKRNS